MELKRKSDLNLRIRAYLNPLIIGTLILSLITLFLEQVEFENTWALIFVQIVDFTLTGLIALELILDLATAPFRLVYIKRNFLSISISIIYIGFFIYTKILAFSGPLAESAFSPVFLIVIRNFFLAFKVIGRVKRLQSLLKSLTLHPAQTLVLSFIMVILVGTLYLMLPFTTIDGIGLGFIDALFTATSAVCVTGLIVVDTATHFTVLGQIGIMILIQIGGLGIMVLSFAALYMTRRSITVQDKLMLAYMINEDDMGRISKGLRSIILLTFGIEAVGFIVLSLGFWSSGFNFGTALWFGLFHAVSAFCNAGFALFSNSLESFSSSFIISMGISLLIIFGSMSFAVMNNLGDIFKTRKKGKNRSQLNINSKVVLIMTAFLIIVGTFMVYALEHNNTLANLSLGEQYLSAFFQSVTLRTAGFNTLSFANLTIPVTIFMLIWMFIGGASGSTAGGIKVNTVAIILAYIRSRFRGEDQVRLGSYALNKETAINSLLVFIFGILVVIAAFFLLTISEDLGSLDLLFETVSAFGTVGLSTGITSNLSIMGKIIIALLMFFGRLGPLTLLTALANKQSSYGIVYPEREIMVG